MSVRPCSPAVLAVIMLIAAVAIKAHRSRKLPSEPPPAAEEPKQVVSQAGPPIDPHCATDDRRPHLARMCRLSAGKISLRLPERNPFKSSEMYLNPIAVSRSITS